MANRDRHRQGLVYGPVRPTGPRDRGRIVGNLLGLLVVVVTFSVLGLAVYFLVQARSAEPPPPPPASATPSVVASPSESASESPSPSSSAPAFASLPVFVPSPLGPASVPPTQSNTTPAPTIFVPSVMIGPGFVTFGTNADGQLHVTDAKAVFGVDEPLVWSAYLTDTANSADLRIRILKLDPTDPSGQRLIREDPVTPNVTGAQIFFRRLRPIGSTEGPGLYTIEYVRGDQIMSTGSFLVQ